jgi:ATP-dependent DNA helicase DinG
MKRLFSENAILRMREEIADAEGNEIFFLGRTDEAKVVVEVEALARGNRDMVAAILIAASFGDVVIHNHPSGRLTPSRADLEIASVLGNQGVGFYITDNRVERCYQAVSPFVRKSLELLSYPEIERFFAPGGTLAENLKGYECREEQARMAFAAAEAFNEDRVAVIEAGTGTGKSLAYLLPSILWATRNRQRVVISTNTINLQEQLTRKDIPFLRKKGGIEFKAVLVKGRSNYLCLRKLDGIERDPVLFKDDPAAGELQEILAWSRKTDDGCRSDLSFIPREETWEEVCCEADQCGRVKCPRYGACFFYKARREASSADILVVNHALLLADVSLRRERGYESSAILPPFDRLVFDEGHHLEDVSTSFFSARISRNGLLKIIGRLQHPRKPQRGILPQLSAQLSREVPEELDNLYMEIASILETRLIPGKTFLADSITRLLDSIALDLHRYLKIGSKKSEERKLRLTPDVYASPFWKEAEEKVRQLAKDIAEYALVVKDFMGACDRLPPRVLEKLAGNLLDLKGIRGRLQGAAESLGFFTLREEGVCHWFEVKNSGKGMIVRLCSSPVEVAESIKSVILDKFRTVVVTSATLAVGDKFDYLEKRTGIGLLDRQRVRELLLASPFDYANQAVVAIPSDMPEPTDAAFEAALRDRLLRALAISRGHAFILFTSYDLLMRTYGALRPSLVELGLAPMRQGEMSRHMLLNLFRKEKNGVLFGTDSFWEGVDVQGKNLEMVVITRLPFRVPTEPIHQARAEHIAAHGGDPFMEYTVPQAVIKFKQGFGRLIRSRDDRGVVLILDRRVSSKSYGTFFLKSLPRAGIISGGSEEVFPAMEKFFADRGGPLSQEAPSEAGAEG